MKAKLQFILSLPLALMLSRGAYGQEIQEFTKIESIYPTVFIRNFSSSPITFQLRSRDGNNAREFELYDGEGAEYGCSGDCENYEIDFQITSLDIYDDWSPIETGGLLTYCGTEEYNQEQCDGEQWHTSW